jgi:hypothetical protein
LRPLPNKPPPHLFLSSCPLTEASLGALPIPAIRRSEHKGGEERKTVPTNPSCCPLSLTTSATKHLVLCDLTRVEQDRVVIKMLEESKRCASAFGARAFPPKPELVEFRTRNFSAGRQAGQSATAADHACGASGEVKKPASASSQQPNERIERAFRARTR